MAKIPTMRPTVLEISQCQNQYNLKTESEENIIRRRRRRRRRRRIIIIIIIIIIIVIIIITITIIMIFNKGAQVAAAVFSGALIS